MTDTQVIAVVAAILHAANPSLLKTHAESVHDAMDLIAAVEEVLGAPTQSVITGADPSIFAIKCPQCDSDDKKFAFPPCRNGKLHKWHGHP